MSQTLSGVIFDMDGLMLDTEPIYWDSMQQAARELGCRFDHEMRAAFIGRSIPAWRDLLMQTFGAARYFSAGRAASHASAGTLPCPGRLRGWRTGGARRRHERDSCPGPEAAVRRFCGAAPSLFFFARGQGAAATVLILPAGRLLPDWNDAENRQGVSYKKQRVNSACFSRFHRQSGSIDAPMQIQA